MTTNTRRITAGLATLLTLVASGCAGRDPQEQPSVPPLGPVATVTSVDAISLPIDAYTPTPAQYVAIQRAIDVVSRRCMRRYGLAYHPPVLQGFDDAIRQNRMRSVVYGFFDLDTARSKGYDTQARPSGNGDTPEEAPYSPVETGVLEGRDLSGAAVTTFNGQHVPVGGCRKEGVDAVGGLPPVPAATALPDGGPKVPANDPRMVDVNARWAECMRAKGFFYPNPWAAYTDPKWSASRPGPTTLPFGHSPEETATATLDVECKMSTNLIGVAIAVETAYDNRYITSHAGALATFKRRLDDRLATAARLTASPAG
ncbi:hypothetical protein [Embleya sp. AB8]|uniref:hypothetical protein n=1 Tax=Embleya sp. AB8 TaxID=3156304 RepID=UPI003C74628E